MHSALPVGRAGKALLPDGRSHAQGGKTGARKRGLPKQTPNDSWLLGRFSDLWLNRPFSGLLRQLCLLLGGKLLLDLQGDCVGVHLVHGGGLPKLALSA